MCVGGGFPCNPNNFPKPQPTTQQAAVELQATNHGRAAYHLLTQRLGSTRPLHPVMDADEIVRSYDKVCSIFTSLFLLWWL